MVANHLALTIELPTSQGSIRTLNAPFTEQRSSDVGSSLAEKIRRKVLSAFRCRTVTDILTLLCVPGKQCVCFDHLSPYP